MFKHTVCAFILGPNTTCEWLWKYKGYCVHSFWVKTINIWSRYVFITTAVHIDQCKINCITWNYCLWSKQILTHILLYRDVQLYKFYNFKFVPFKQKMNYSELYSHIIVMIVEMCPILHKWNFSVFVEDVPCPTSVSLLSVWWRCALSYISSTSQCLMEMCPVLHQFHFSVFDGDVPFPT